MGVSVIYFLCWLFTVNSKKKIQCNKQYEYYDVGSIYWNALGSSELRFKNNS